LIIKVLRESLKFHNPRTIFIKNQIINSKNIDLTLFLAFSILIIVFALFFSIANITHDSIDYYSILSGIVSPNEKAIVNNTFFVEQRAPGYSVLSVPAYIGVSLVELVFQREEVILESELVGPKAPEGFFPKVILRATDVLFKKISLFEQNSFFDCKIFTSLFITSILFLILGFFFASKTLWITKLNNKTSFLFLIGLIIIASPIFIQSIIQTPLYATLCAFGISSILTYFLVKGFFEKNNFNFFIAGILLAVLSFVRFEGILLGLTITLFLFLFKEKEYSKNTLKGFLLLIPMFLVYNLFVLNNIFSFAFLKGDLNKILIDINFILQATILPESGLLFFSPLIIIGIIGLFFSKEKLYKIFGFASIIFIISICLRVPVICTCSEGEIIIAGIEQVMCSVQSCTQLVQSDINRYVIILIPFALIGLQNIFYKVTKKLRK